MAWRTRVCEYGDGQGAAEGRVRDGRQLVLSVVVGGSRRAGG